MQAYRVAKDALLVSDHTNHAYKEVSTFSSAALAAVTTAARGIQTPAAVVTMCSFQPYTQLCQPDLVQDASVSIKVCGTMPASRSFLCQTPPREHKTVLWFCRR